MPRVAAGLAGLAALVEPSTVVISGTTQQIAGNGFVYDSLGTHSGKAIGRDVGVFTVLRENEAVTDGAGSRSELIGREHETGLLKQSWQQALGGSGQVALVCAEAGSASHGCCRHFAKDWTNVPILRGPILRGEVLDLSSKQCLLSDQRAARTACPIELR